MFPAKNRETIKSLMLAIALIAVILYVGIQFYKSYVWMVKAGY